MRDAPVERFGVDAEIQNSCCLRIASSPIMSDLEENENSSESERNVEENEQERVCFICGLSGDPIYNR